MVDVTASARPASAARAWSIGLWVAQVLLALLFAFAGFVKLTQTPEALATMNMAWAPEFPLWFIKTLGALELAGAIGIVLPALTRILPWLTPLAAAGIVLVQLSAIVLHAVRGETANTLVLNLVILALALFVIWGRVRKAPVTPR